ncbi:low specificity L-threonine aldolase, partial [Klebsiella pneumoniae]
MLPIDLRSDTVTRPTEAMTAAMAQAPLGDDSRDGDPTVGRL